MFIFFRFSKWLLSITTDLITFVKVSVGCVLNVEEGWIEKFFNFLLAMESYWSDYTNCSNSLWIIFVLKLTFQPNWTLDVFDQGLDWELYICGERYVRKNFLSTLVQISDRSNSLKCAINTDSSQYAYVLFARNS